MLDKAAALRDMHRVLVPGGRLALSIWRSLQENPYVRALAEALERHVSPEAGASMRAPCGFGDAEALRALLAAAGFRNIHLDHITLLMRHATPAAFIPGQLAATPLAGAVAALGPASQHALVADILATLQPYLDAEGLTVPQAALVALAWK
jgi:hypothetical protein